MQGTPPFALLDDHSASAAHATSRLYTGWVGEHRCTDPAELDATWAAVQADLARGLHAVLLADYEWGCRLQGAGERPGSPGALRMLMFRRCEHLGREAVDAWLQARDSGAAEPTPAGFSRLQASVSDADFHDAIDRIHEWIRAGETYQVNYTYRLNGQAWGEPVGLYRRLRMRQPVPFGALIALPGQTSDHGASSWVLSCSPELFLTHRQGTLTTRPMKGTAARLTVPEADNAMAFWLADDEKNRAENLMIVDLLRNDLGRIARTGSVKVPSLFAVEPYRTVFQMTSTVQAEVAPDTGLPQVLRALFPCGSITGAPKHHTMELIAQLESTPRGLYTGAIGWLDAPAPDGRAMGDFCLNVAIRTVTLGPAQATGERPAQLGVGAGITLDSVAADEAQECRLKARYATALPHGFTLFETIRVDEGQAALLERHLARLGASALALGFEFDVEAARSAVVAHAQGLPATGAPYRLRLDLGDDGQCQVRSAPLPPLPPGAVTLRLASEPLVSTPRHLLRHKTSLRAEYDAAILAAEQAGAFDTLYVDEAGWLTEGARSSVFVQLEGRWCTPPVASGGLLPGVMRAQVLADPAWQAVERPVHRDQLAQAAGLMVCNALRGCLRAQWLAEPRATAGAS